MTVKNTSDRIGLESTAERSTFDESKLGLNFLTLVSGLATDVL